MTLSPAQQAAVDAPDSRILCLAAPGSGKTRVMVERCARLLRQGYHPKEILVLTFTRKAAGWLANFVGALVATSTVEIGIPQAGLDIHWMGGK